MLFPHYETWVYAQLVIRMDALRRMQSYKAKQTGQTELQSGRAFVFLLFFLVLAPPSK